MEIDQAYFEAAKTIASCPQNRLSFVIDTFRKAGLEFPEPEVINATIPERDRTRWLKESRSTQSRGKWEDTDDPFVLQLRQAYENGESFTRLARAVGLARCTLYQYLYGSTKPSLDMVQNILRNLTKV